MKMLAMPVPINLKSWFIDVNAQSYWLLLVNGIVSNKQKQNSNTLDDEITSAPHLNTLNSIDELSFIQKNPSITPQSDPSLLAYIHPNSSTTNLLIDGTIDAGSNSGAAGFWTNR